jgi:hypothetical protein
MSALREELVDLIAEEGLVDRAKLTPDATLAGSGLDSVGKVAENAFSGVSTLGQLLDVLETLISEKAKS